VLTVVLLRRPQLVQRASESFAIAVLLVVEDVGVVGSPDEYRGVLRGFFFRGVVVAHGLFGLTGLVGQATRRRAASAARRFPT